MQIFAFVNLLFFTMNKNSRDRLNEGNAIPDVSMKYNRAESEMLRNYRDSSRKLH